jgi:hypothetical protein
LRPASKEQLRPKSFFEKQGIRDKTEKEGPDAPKPMKKVKKTALDELASSKTKWSIHA